MTAGSYRATVDAISGGARLTAPGVTVGAYTVAVEAISGGETATAPGVTVGAYSAVVLAISGGSSVCPLTLNGYASPFPLLYRSVRSVLVSTRSHRPTSSMMPSIGAFAKAHAPILNACAPANTPALVLVVFGVPSLTLIPMRLLTESCQTTTWYHVPVEAVPKLLATTVV